MNEFAVGHSTVRRLMAFDVDDISFAKAMSEFLAYKRKVYKTTSSTLTMRRYH